MEGEGKGDRDTGREGGREGPLPLLSSLTPCDGNEEQGPLLFPAFCSTEVLTGWQAEGSRGRQER